LLAKMAVGVAKVLFVPAACSVELKTIGKWLARS